MPERADLEDALARMPHRGAMRLIEAIGDVDATAITCRARPHDAADFPLRLDGHLDPAALTELGAQAAAAHASLYGMGAAHTGLVMSMSRIDIKRDCVPNGGKLMISAQRISALEAAASYRFTIGIIGLDAEREEILSGEVLLSMVKAET